MDVAEFQEALLQQMERKTHWAWPAFTGGLAAGKPHPELFMMYPRGLGMDVERFAKVQLLPAAHAYRGFLDDVAEACSITKDAVALTA